MSRKLNSEAQKNRDDFDRCYPHGGCSCHISPPCGYCTHPGNPLCQEDDDCWEEEEIDCVCVSLLNGHEIGCPYHKG
jgi:hypothetical protein